MPRTIARALLALAVTVGLSALFVVPAGTAQAATGPDVASAPVARLAGQCADERMAVRLAKREIDRAKRDLARAQDKENRAAIKQARRDLKQAKKDLKPAKKALAGCHDSDSVVTTTSKVQVLCDAATELQPLCDAVGAGLILLPSGTDSPIQALCDAVPAAQPLCDALAGGGLPDDPTVLVDVLLGLVTDLLDTLGLCEILPICELLPLRTA